MCHFQAVLPECKVNNLTSDWNGGTNLCALLDYCKPGLFSNWRDLDPTNRYKFSYSVPILNCSKNISRFFLLNTFGQCGHRGNTMVAMVTIGIVGIKTRDEIKVLDTSYTGSGF